MAHEGDPRASSAVDEARETRFLMTVALTFCFLGRNGARDLGAVSTGEDSGDEGGRDAGRRDGVDGSSSHHQYLSFSTVRPMA